MNPFKSKKGLGRGLSSLIGDTPSAQRNNNVPISSLINFNHVKFSIKKN
jgi:hypothetical protein